MSGRESRRSGVLARVEAGQISQVEAGAMMGVSYRQAKRLWKRYQKGGAASLVHGNVGKASSRAKDPKVKARALKLVKKYYQGPGEPFGPTLAAEHLRDDHNIVVDAETLRRWMLAAGLWQRERKRKAYRQRRPRRAHFGELVQMDGSFEAWFEDRGPRGCMITMVDDATSSVLGRIGEEETTWAVAAAMRAWVEKYGVPRALYVDWKNVYHHAPTEKQKEQGISPVSQFGRMCAKLGVELIGANSPQAKGRVERSHGTHQDRLIKKMRLKKIGTYEAANRYLEKEYLPQHNERYSVAASEAVDFHIAVAADVNLDDVFCLEEERKVSNDWVVQYGQRWFQVAESPYVPVGSSVLVRERRDGSIRLVWGKIELQWRELAGRPRKVETAKPARREPRPNVPDASHPWRHSFTKNTRQSGTAPSPSPIVIEQSGRSVKDSLRRASTARP
jgi:transposase